MNTSPPPFNGSAARRYEPIALDSDGIDPVARRNIREQIKRGQAELVATTADDRDVALWRVTEAGRPATVFFDGGPRDEVLERVSEERRAELTLPDGRLLSPMGKEAFDRFGIVPDFQAMVQKAEIGEGQQVEGYKNSPSRAFLWITEKRARIPLVYDADRNVILRLMADRETSAPGKVWREKNGTKRQRHKGKPHKPWGGLRPSD